MADFLQMLQQALSGASNFVSPQTPQPVAGPPSSSGAVNISPGQPGGPAAPVSGGAAGLLNNPLVEGALQTYLGYLASPRGEPRWQRLGQGGLAGLQGFQQAEQRQTSLPMQQQQLQQAQQQTQLGQRALAPLAPDTLQAIQQWRQKLESTPGTEPQELAQARTLEAQARGGTLSNEQALKALQNFGAQKAQAAMLKAQSGAQMMAAMAPFLSALGIQIPQTPSAPVPAAGGSSAAPMAALPPSVPSAPPSHGAGPTEADLAGLPPGSRLDTVTNPNTGHPDAILPDGRHMPWIP